MAMSHDANEAIFKAIKNTATALESSDANVLQKATALQSLALAYGYAVGGQQPDASVVAK